MLVLSRQLNESIIISGNIIVKVLRVDRDQVKIGIQAPPDVEVHRHEVYEAIKNKGAQHAAARNATLVGEARIATTIAVASNNGNGAPAV